MDLCCKAQRIQNLSYAQSFPLVPREEQGATAAKAGGPPIRISVRASSKAGSASLSHFSISKSCRAPAISAVISRCHSRSVRRATKLSRARATLQEEVPPSSYHVTVTSQNLVRTPKARLVAHHLRSRCAEVAPASQMHSDNSKRSKLIPGIQAAG